MTQSRSTSAQTHVGNDLVAYAYNTSTTPYPSSGTAVGAGGAAYPTSVSHPLAAPQDQDEVEIKQDSGMPIRLPPYQPQPALNGDHAHPFSHQRQHQHHASILQETEEELTEDEKIAYEDGLLTWDKAKKWRFWVRKEWAWYYIAFVLLIVVVALMAFFHHSIINWLTPFTRKLEALPAGYVIPVAILFVLSFPPLFGNEIVMILVGIVWGLGKGFAIVAIGMSLGEIANYFVFKYWCSARAERMTKKSLNYACLAQVVRDGGFWMAFMIRLSAVPTHFSTVLFAVCGLPFWQYCLALIAGLPKQLIAVYVGVVLAGSEGDTSRSTSSTVISDCVFAATALITLGALWFVHRKMIQVRKKVLIAMRGDLAGKGVRGLGEVPGANGVETGNGRS